MPRNSKFKNDFSEAAVESNQVAKGYCAPYNGQVCRQYLVGRGLVWFNVSQDNSGGWLNEQITQNLWEEVIVKLKEPCRSSAEVFEVSWKQSIHVSLFKGTIQIICDTLRWGPGGVDAKKNVTSSRMGTGQDSLTKYHMGLGGGLKLAMTN